MAACATVESDNGAGDHGQQKTTAEILPAQKKRHDYLRRDLFFDLFSPKPLRRFLFRLVAFGRFLFGLLFFRLFQRVSLTPISLGKTRKTL